MVEPCGCRFRTRAGYRLPALAAQGTARSSQNSECWVATTLGTGTCATAGPMLQAVDELQKICRTASTNQFRILCTLENNVARSSSLLHNKTSLLRQVLKTSQLSSRYSQHSYSLQDIHNTHVLQLHNQDAQQANEDFGSMSSALVKRVSYPRRQVFFLSTAP